MYIGDNKTALMSQKLIADALLILLNCRSFSDISISELCKEAQVSRQTFYTLFQSKENVIIYELESKYPFSMEILTDREKFSLHEFCCCYSLYIKINFEFLKLIINNGLSQVLFDCFYHSIISCEHVIPKEYEKNRDYIAGFIAGGLTSIAKNYVTKEPFDDSDFIENLTYSLFSGTFFHQ